MLGPDARAVLLDHLRPPAGFQLDAAVATTFTLDLTAALVPPLAFAAFEFAGVPDPVAVMQAVRRCAERVDIFCQGGQINIPSQASDLTAFVEQMVHEVRRPRPYHLFHPKLWLLRYADEDGSTTHRLLCLTRNLTNDHSWDLVLRLDGESGGAVKATNRPIAELLWALPDLSVKPLGKVRQERLTRLADEFRRVEWECPEGVNALDFHVFGVPAYYGRPDFSGYRHLVISPFLNDAGLDVVAPDDRDVSVVSRVEELDRLTPETAEVITPYVVSAIAGIEPASLDEATENASPQQVLSGLHAKLYVVERDKRAHVFVGSANATDAAFNGNVEFLVELIGGATKLGVSTFLDPDAPFRTLLEEYATTGGAPPDPSDEALRALADALRDLAEIPYRAIVLPDGDRYRVELVSGKRILLEPGFDLSVELLTRPGEGRKLSSGESAHAAFPGIPLADITPFIAFRVRTPDGLVGGTVVRAALENDPAGRLDEVLARQVDTPEKFMRFVALLLGLADPNQLAFGDSHGKDASAVRIGPGHGVFELILRALADNPRTLDDLDQLVRHLQATERGRAVLPEGFDELWPVVQAAKRQIRK